MKNNFLEVMLNFLVQNRRAISISIWLKSVYHIKYCELRCGERDSRLSCELANYCLTVGNAGRLSLTQCMRWTGRCLIVYLAALLYIASLIGRHFVVPVS